MGSAGKSYICCQTIKELLATCFPWIWFSARPLPQHLHRLQTLSPRLYLFSRPPLPPPLLTKVAREGQGPNRCCQDSDRVCGVGGCCWAWLKGKPENGHPVPAVSSARCVLRARAGRSGWWQRGGSSSELLLSKESAIFHLRGCLGLS